MVTRAITRARQFSGIRPVAPLRDLPSVVGLIDEAFRGELGLPAQHTLRDLRRLSRTAWLLGPFLWMTPFAELLAGFVWAEGQEVVGNVTVTASRGGGPGCWLISNVVVDPAYRGRGIGRALMEEALSHIYHRNGRLAVLQVRANNQVALRLYEDMGFVAVDTLLEMRKPPDGAAERVRRPVPEPAADTRPAQLPLRRRGYGEWHEEYLLARQAVSPAVQRMHPVERRAFRVDWDDRFFRWFTDRLGSVREYRLGISEQSALLATLRVWAGRWRAYHRLGIVIHPNRRGEWEEGLVDHALDILRRYASRPVYIEVPGEHQALVMALRARGFVADRELVQMELDLAKGR